MHNEKDEQPIKSWQMAHDLIVRMEVLAPGWRLWSVEWLPYQACYKAVWRKMGEGYWMEWRALPSDEDVTALLTHFQGV